MKIGNRKHIPYHGKSRNISMKFEAADTLGFGKSKNGDNKEWDSYFISFNTPSKEWHITFTRDDVARMIEHFSKD